MPATNLRLLKKLLLQRFHLIIGLPVLQVKGVTRMVVDGEGLQSKVILNDGCKMPLFGLGVFKALGDDGKGAVKFALQNVTFNHVIKEKTEINGRRVNRPRTSDYRCMKYP